MILNLDEFDENERLRIVHVDASVEQLNHLLSDSGYRVTAPLNTDLEANLVGTTVRLRGLLRVEVEFECGRCLEMQRVPLELDAEFVLMERSEWAAKYESEDELELDDDDMDVSFYEGDQLDLAPLVREAILLDLPLLPRCPDEGREACDEAFRRNVGEAAAKKLDDAAIDHRWSALKNIKLKD